VIARITPGGRTLLARLDEPVQEIHLKQLGHLGRNGLGALGELLRAARASVGCFSAIFVATIIVITHL
jgi:hypothetical protein